MQLKTIRKNIEMKMDQWLATITDEGLRKKVKSKILVSGGSITSLFLNEKVNDYDVYIMDHDVLVELAAYYTAPFSNIKILDGQKKDLLNPGDNGIYAVSVANLKPDQVKLYFEEKNGGMKVNEGKEQGKFEYFPVFFSPNAISLSDNVQVVLRFHGDAETIHKTFDFIHATNYFTFKDGLVTNKPALESILTKQLKYQGSLYPLTTIIRIKKFIKRGWNITAGETLKVMFQISELDLKNPDVLEDQLIGIDIAYFSALIEILRGVPEEKFNSGYINTIIDKVFDGAEETEEE
jgi:hypothetical protein